MKYFFALLFLLSRTVYSQETISKVSKNRDTLWLINSDTGRMIAQTWDSYVNETKPFIIFVDEFEKSRNYYYRFIVESIDSKNFAKEIFPQVREIFQSEPTFFEEIDQFQVSSSIQIEEKDLTARISRKITYFKCSTQ